MTDRPTTRLAAPDEQDISLFALGAIVVRNRRRIARWMLAGGLVAAVSASLKPVIYSASVAFVQQGGEQGRSNLASLAGQLGVSIPTTGGPQSPEFYQRLLVSRVVLEPIVRDTFVVQEMGGRRMSFVDLFEAKGNSPRRRVEVGMGKLRSMLSPSVSKTTGVVEVSVATRWPSVSAAILDSLVSGINGFNQETRQGQAAAERRFVERRLAVASGELRAAEDRMTQFLRANRAFEGSPQLRFEHDRLQRDVDLKQQVFSTLTQAFEDARVREVRDTPVITVIEPPSMPTIAEPRRRVRNTLLGLIGGALLGTIVVFVSEMLARRRREGDADAEEFAAAISGMKPQLFNRTRRRRAPAR